MRADTPAPEIPTESLWRIAQTGVDGVGVSWMFVLDLGPLFLSHRDFPKETTKVYKSHVHRPQVAGSATARWRLSRRPDGMETESWFLIVMHGSIPGTHMDYNIYNIGEGITVFIFIYLFPIVG